MSDIDAPGCGFCDQIRGRVPAPPNAFDDGRFVVLIGRYQPTGPGYALVVSHDHIQDLRDLSEVEYGPTLQMVSRTSAAIQRAFGVSGTTVLQNNGAPGQSVPHLHFHVVPRWAGDGYPKRSDVAVPDDELAEQAEKLAAALASTAR